MPRGATRRTWVKFFITGWLHGSIRWQLEPAERSVWADLICLAGECGKEGKIIDNDDQPYPLSYIASHLNIPLELLSNTMTKCQEQGRLNLNGTGILEIVNWAVYQSEYDRQKPYREAKKCSDDPNKFTKGDYGGAVRR